jgi:hypothetical protein
VEYLNFLANCESDDEGDYDACDNSDDECEYDDDYDDCDHRGDDHDDGGNDDEVMVAVVMLRMNLIMTISMGGEGVMTWSNAA